MTYEEYKKIFEEIYALVQELEELCKKKKFDDIEKPFSKYNELFSKLSTPTEDLDEEKVNYILELRDKIKEKNDFILKAIKIQKNEIKKELLEVKQESKVIEKYKIPTGDINSSIFDSKE